MPVAQRIEQWPPTPCAMVRFHSGIPASVTLDPDRSLLCRERFSFSLDRQRGHLFYSHCTASVTLDPDRFSLCGERFSFSLDRQYNWLAKLKATVHIKVENAKCPVGSPNRSKKQIPVQGICLLFL